MVGGCNPLVSPIPAVSSHRVRGAAAGLDGLVEPLAPFHGFSSGGSSRCDPGPHTDGVTADSTECSGAGIQAEAMVTRPSPPRNGPFGEWATEAVDHSWASIRQPSQ